MDFPRGKRRTPEHVLADVAVNYVERVFLRAGCSLQRLHMDYGIDLLVVTHDAKGYVEAGWLSVQVKGVRKPRWREGSVAVTVGERDVAYWLRQRDPVLLIVYDGEADQAHWVDIHGYFRSRPRQLLRYQMIQIPRTSVLDLQSVRKMRARKARLGRS